MTINIKQVRGETPAVNTILHFNNAGASLPPQPVLEVVIEHLKLEAKMGAYEAANLNQASSERFYTAFAELLGALPEEIAFAENATRAWDMVFYAIPFKKEDRILTCMSEYASNYIAYLQVAEKTGAIVEPIPNDAFGQVDVAALRGMIDERVKLISITHVPTNGGLINPAKEIGKIAKEANILYLLDACQSVGQMPVNVQEIGCDMLSATGRKYLRGPRGTGVLYVNKDIIEKLIPPFLDLHAAEWVSKDKYLIRKDAQRFENWERYVAGQIGLARAVDYLLSLGVDNTWLRIQSMANRLRSELAKLSFVDVKDLGENKCGIVSFSVEGLDVQTVYQRLQECKINVSISAKQYTLLDMESRHLDNVLRASVHYYNNDEEMDRFIQVLKTLKV